MDQPARPIDRPIADARADARDKHNFSLHLHDTLASAFRGGHTAVCTRVTTDSDRDRGCKCGTWSSTGSRLTSARMLRRPDWHATPWETPHGPPGVIRPDRRHCRDPGCNV